MTKIKVNFEPNQRLIKELEMLPVNKEETQVFSADIEFFKKHATGNSLIFLEALLEYDATMVQRGGYSWVIDTRIHMLKDGWYPCIPGWHCDNWRRIDGQPVQNAGEEDDIHLLTIVGDTAMTRFIGEPVSIKVNPEKKMPFWGQVDKKVRKLNINYYDVVSGDLTEFRSNALHCGRPANLPLGKTSWRQFFRATYSNKCRARNEIRHQSQIYADLSRGW